MWAESDGQLVISSGTEKNQVFRLPFGNDFHKGISLIREYSKEEYPRFWVQDGKRLDELEEYLGRGLYTEEECATRSIIYI